MPDKRDRCKITTRVRTPPLTRTSLHVNFYAFYQQSEVSEINFGV